MEGNTIANKDPRFYKTFCFVHLPQLKYLDFSRITEAQVTAAKDSGLHVEQDLLSDSQRMEAEANVERGNLLLRLEKAHIEVAILLFDDLFVEDLEYARFKSIPGLSLHYDKFQAQFEGTGKLLQERGLQISENIEVRSSDITVSIYRYKIIFYICAE